MTTRFVARWSNGYWKVFDTYEFVDMGVYDSERAAFVAAERMN
jgi:hypothetical protein